MPSVRHEALVECFEGKLSGEVARRTEHIHYRFRIGDRVVATTHISPPSSYGDISDSIITQIGRQLRITGSLLKKSVRCDDEATRDILSTWRATRR